MARGTFLARAITRLLTKNERIKMDDETIEKTLENETKESLERIQRFNLESLPRVDDLGSKMNFGEVVKPAKRLVELYRRLTVTALQDFPNANLTAIKNSCDANYNLFQQVIDFDLAEQANPNQVRESYINQIELAHDAAFNILRPFISYSLHRSADFQRLDTESRAAFQQIKDESEKIKKELEKQKTDAEGILKDIRNTAAEQGVTQQAIYFKEESENHENQAKDWERRTKWLAGFIALYAVLSLFIHKWEWISPENTYETIQFVVSKVLIFAILIYLLLLSAKNYLNHKHNSIVNKHRQNALVTYKALVDASGDDGAKEAVLIQAASCIFNPQSTGYTDTSNSMGNGRSLVEILSKPAVQAVTNATK